MSAEGSFEALVAPLRALPGPAWVVGGGLRDALMGRPVADLDVAVGGDVEAAARALARAHGAGRFPLSVEFGGWRVHGGRLPFTVDVVPLVGGALAEDLARRDFTVNALALDVGAPERVIDRHGGLDDLRARRLRLVRPDALAADPVRVLRLVRLGHTLGMEIAPEAAAQSRRDAAGLATVSPERVMDEIGRMTAIPGAWRAVERLDEFGALTVLVPELERGRGLEQNPYHHRDVLGHILEVVRHASQILDDPEPVFRSLAPRVRDRLDEPLADDMSRGQSLLLGALFHDIAKPATHAVTPEGRVTFMGHDERGAAMADTWLRAMRVANRLRRHVVLMVRCHLPLGFLVHSAPLSLRQMDRYLRSTSPAEVEIIALSAADRLATDGPKTTEMQITRHLALARELVRVQFALEDRGPVRPIIDGTDICDAVGRPPGPWLVPILDALREEQVVGRVRNREEAVKFVSFLCETRDIRD